MRKITNFLYRVSIRNGFGRPTPIMMIGLGVLLVSLSAQAELRPDKMRTADGKKTNSYLLDGMFVGGDGIAEGKSAQRLERVVELVKPDITDQPPPVPQREQVRRERGQAEEVVAAVDHHVDGEVVAGKDHEIRAGAISQQYAFPLHLAVQGGMFCTYALLNAKKSLISFQIIDFAERCKLGSQFEGDKPRGVFPDLGIRFDHGLG